MREQPRGFTANELRLMNCRASSLGYFPSEPKDERAEILTGSFRYGDHAGGLSFHGGSFTELHDLKTCFEVPAGISINVVLEGCIEFTLAGKDYQLACRADQAPASAAIILPQTDVLTRHLRQGQSVRKLNVFVERGWLEQRCANAADYDALRGLFAHTAQLIRWNASERIKKLALAILSQRGGDLQSKLTMESLAIELLSASLGQMNRTAQQAEYTVELKAQSLYLEQQRLKQTVDDCLHQCHSLSSLAELMNMSVSTLQRRFKTAFGMTAIDYLRQRRLEIARRAMIEQDATVGEAAFIAGYKYSSNFVTAFKKQFSMTPDEWKRAHVLFA